LGERLQRPVQAGVEEQVATAEQAPVRLVDAGAFARYQCWRDRGEGDRLLVGQRDATAGQRDGRLDDLGPGQPAPAAVHLGDPGRYPGHADARAADRVAERYPAELDLDGYHRPGGPVAVGTGYRAEEVQAGHLAGTGVEVGGEAAPADPGQDAFGGAAGERGGCGGVRGGATPGEHAEPDL